MSNPNEDELELARQITEEQFEPIEPLAEYRKRIDKLMNEEKELDMLKLEARELQVRLDTIKEKKRIEDLRNKLDGKVYCDDCHKWVDLSHFD